MSLVERIEQLAAEQGISIKRLEAECGIGNGTIRKWNSQNGPALGSIEKVAKFLHSTIHYIATGEEVSPPGITLTPGEQAVYEQIHELSEGEKFKLAGALPFIRMMQDTPYIVPSTDRERATVGLFSDSTSRE